jgi:hypothetical protein
MGLEDGSSGSESSPLQGVARIERIGSEQHPPSQGGTSEEGSDKEDILFDAELAIPLGFAVFDMAVHSLQPVSCGIFLTIAGVLQRFLGHFLLHCWVHI